MAEISTAEAAANLRALLDTNRGELARLRAERDALALAEQQGDREAVHKRAGVWHRITALEQVIAEQEGALHIAEAKIAQEADATRAQRRAQDFSDVHSMLDERDRRAAKIDKMVDTLAAEMKAVDDLADQARCKLHAHLNSNMLMGIRTMPAYIPVLGRLVRMGVVSDNFLPPHWIGEKVLPVGKVIAEHSRVLRDRTI